MSLSARTMKVTYTGDNSNTTFAMPDVPILDDSAEVVVYTRDETATPPTVTLMVEGALNDYTLTGAPDANSFHTNVEFNTAPATGLLVIVTLVLPFTQVLNYNGNNSAGIRPTQLEEALDRAIGMIQQMEEQLSRVPKMNITEQNTTASMELATPTAATEGFFGYDTSGNVKVFTIGELAFSATGLPDTDSVPEGSVNLYYTAARVLALMRTSDAVETITASGDIASGTALVQYRPVVGDAGAQAASTTPFGTGGGWANGTEIILRGTNDTNTVLITHNDAAKGAILNGNAVLAKNNVLTLVYDSTDDRWIEVSRNF